MTKEENDMALCRGVFLPRAYALLCARFTNSAAVLLTLVLIFHTACVSDESNPAESSQTGAELPHRLAKDEDPLAASEEDDLGNSGDSSAAESSSKATSELSEPLELPEFFERIDLDRFMRKRRTLYVKYLPLDQKFNDLNVQFAPGTVLDREAEENLKSWVYEDVRRAHWVFLQGLYIALEKLTDRQRPLLKEQQKGLIVQYTKTLSFIAACLDDKTKNVRYKEFVKRVYRTLASRYLYREVRERSF